MEIAVGFKQTEIGILPDDWDVKPIRSFGTPVRGASPRPAGDPRYFDGAYIPWLTVAALTNIPPFQLVVSKTATRLTEEGSLHSRTLLPGTLIIANSGATLGVAKVLGIKCCANDGIAAVLSLQKDVSPRYLAYFINTRTKYLREVVASGNGQPNLNTELIGNLRIALPPTKSEQEAIAQALSDVDVVTASLERMLVKKRDIKQGAMQELLTGKRRLPGFNGEWTEKTIREFTDCTAGGTPSTRVPGYWGGSIRWMSSGELHLKRVLEVEGRITELGLKNSSTKMVPKRCVLIGLAGQGKTRGTVAINMVPLCTNQSVAAIYPNDSFEPLFLYYNLDTRYDELRELSSGEGGRGGLNLTLIRSLRINLPPTKEEQVAIAAVLSDLDKEIELLVNRLAKLKLLRQGMEQELLTGRIRLK